MILSASVGAGHIRAAEAVAAALPAEGHQVVNIDVLSRMPAAFRKVYRDAYLDLVGKAPHVLGWLYAATDKPFHKDPLRMGIEKAAAQKLLDEVRAFAPDVAICTHFMPAALLDRERRKRRFQGKILTVVTDFEVHGMWLATPSDHYFVATEEARAHLEALGIEAARISITGIPVHPSFAAQKARDQMRRKHGLDAEAPVILLSAGGFGAGNAGRLVEALGEALEAARVPAQIVAICGKSAPLKAAMDKIARRAKNVIPVGFTTEIDEWMSAADLMLGKPGGLTVSESLVKGLGWIVVNPIPGQEERNAIYLLENGAGIWCNNLHTVAHKVAALLRDADRVRRMRAAALALAHPNAAADVARFALGA